MKVLVCGSRSFNNYQLLKETLDQVGGITQIIQGGAKGADKLAGQYAREHSISALEIPAKWGEYGKKAGYIRNQEMIDYNPDLVVAFWDGESRGTAHTINLATHKRIKVEVIKFASSN